MFQRQRATKKPSNGSKERYFKRLSELERLAKQYNIRCAVTLEGLCQFALIQKALRQAPSSEWKKLILLLLPEASVEDDTHDE